MTRDEVRFEQLVARLEDQRAAEQAEIDRQLAIVEQRRMQRRVLIERPINGE